MNILDVLYALMSAGALAFLLYGLWICVNQVAGSLLALGGSQVARGPSAARRASAANPSAG